MRSRLLLFLTLFLLALPLSASASPEITDERATADYWTARNPAGDTLVLTAGEVEKTNAAMRAKNSTPTDLAALPTTLSAADITARIDQAQELGGFGDSLPAVYQDSAPLSWESYAAVLTDSAPPLAPTNDVRYAVTLRRADLLLPVAAGWFESAGDTHYDDLQGTALDPGEPVAILTGSTDGAYAFVVTRFYDGWVRRSDLGEMARPLWLSLVHPADYAVVTANKRHLANASGEDLLFQMGAHIPLVTKDGKTYLALPDAASENHLSFVPFAEDEGLHHGDLPCTENNFIRQAFHFLGDNYGWGGLEESVDCSAFTSDVYHSMGLEIPRDADQQTQVLPHFSSLGGLDESARWQTLAAYRPGALLASPTHVSSTSARTRTAPRWSYRR